MLEKSKHMEDRLIWLLVPYVSLFDVVTSVLPIEKYSLSLLSVFSINMRHCVICHVIPHCSSLSSFKYILCFLFVLLSPFNMTCAISHFYKKKKKRQSHKCHLILIIGGGTKTTTRDMQFQSSNSSSLQSWNMFVINSQTHVSH